MKEEIDINVGEEFTANSLTGLKIDDLIIWLSDVKSKGATQIDIREYDNGFSIGGGGVEMEAYYSRLETEEECSQRLDREIEREKQHKNEIEQMEKLQLERLKQKYE